MEETEDFEWPSEGELVLCNVINVRDFGAFADLEEYEGKEGFIHISEISSGWVKRIRNHIQEGQKRVCKVLRVNKYKGHIDLSLKQVNDHQKREKIQAWKNHKKAEKLLALVGEEISLTVDQCYEKFGYDLLEEYGSLYEAFEECTMDPNTLKKHGFEGEWCENFVQIAQDNISPPYVHIVGIIELSSNGPKGVEDIKESLSVVEDTEESKIEVSYLAAPRYRIEVQSPDYKTAEEDMEHISKKIIEDTLKRGGDGKFYRDE